jgi:hypothetical protein
MAYTYSELVTLVQMRCGGCGIPFAVPDYFQQERKENGGNFYCPNGHSRVYREPDVERLTRELRAAQAQAVHAEDQRKAAERRAAAARKRVGNGVCPCCHRTFQQLSRHMKAKHPDYADSH